MVVDHNVPKILINCCHVTDQSLNLTKFKEEEGGHFIILLFIFFVVVGWFS